MHVFKHPKYYEEMRQRAKKFQKEEKLKQQASSTKRFKNPGAGFITRGTSIKLQAPSYKLSYIFPLIKFWKHGTGIKN